VADVHWLGACFLGGMAFGQNTRTLLATFDDYSAARQAGRELEDSGIPADAIRIDSNRKTAGAGTAQYQNQEEHEGGFKEWWNSLFGSSDDEARQDYEGALSSGGTVMRVTVAAEAMDRAVDILNRHGASVGTQSRTESSTGARARTAENTGRGPVQVVEEELQVGKRAVQRGGVRIYSHVVTEPVEQQVRLREEHVNVERRKVDREISPDEVNALRDQTIEVTEMAEEPVLAKRARVREEVVVGKEATERTETIRDNLRRTEVEVEQLGAETQRGQADFTNEYRRDYQQRYGSDTEFETVRPAYEYGYRSHADTRYQGRSWDDAENDLRSEYERSNPSGKWEQVKNSVRYGWDKMTGR
jgi:uncharacterized protein (TIGR02271 family)